MPGTGLGSAVVVWNPRMLPVLDELLFPGFALGALGHSRSIFTSYLVYDSVFAVITMRMGVLKSRFFMLVVFLVPRTSAKERAGKYLMNE